MMTRLSIIAGVFNLFLLSNFYAFGQSDTWTKTDRSNLFDDCLSTISKYKSATIEQKESIALCYINEFTKKFEKKEFDAMIDIEIKRAKEATINHCAKTLGIELSTQTPTVIEPITESKPKAEEPKSTSSVPSRDLLIGKWKTNNAMGSVLEFKKDGTFTEVFTYMQMDANSLPYIDNMMWGDWFLDESGKLTLNANYKTDKGVFKEKFLNYIETIEYKFISFSKDYFKIDRLNKTLPQMIQANKME